MTGAPLFSRWSAPLLITELVKADFAVPAYLDYVATFTWALSGAIVGARRGYDIVGVFVIALVSSSGGGLIRDGLLLQRTPSVLVNGTYLVLVGVASLVVAVLARRILRLPPWLSADRLIEVIDAVGVPAFVVVGMQLAAGAGLSLPGVILVGVVNGVGGGLLRDVIAGDKPLLLLPGQFSSLAVIVAALTFAWLTRWLEFSSGEAGYLTIGIHFILRSLMIRFNWKTDALIRTPSG